MSKNKVFAKVRRKAPTVDSKPGAREVSRAAPESAPPAPTTGTVARAAEEVRTARGTGQARGMATLQRSVGNARVSRLLASKEVQARLKVGKVGDPHEQEADRVADGAAAGGSTEPVDRFVSQQARRQAEEEEAPAQTMTEEEEPTQAMAEEEEKPAQTMTEEEEPAQTMAEEEEKPAQTMTEEEEPAQTMPEEEEKPAQAMAEEEQPAQASHLPTESKGTAHEVDHPTLEARVRAPGGGQPLPDGVRSRMERATGHDLSSVRVHDTARDRADSKRLKAKAFTRGKHVWLGPGQSTGDSKLMAHELTHVVQQGAAPKQRKAKKKAED